MEQIKFQISNGQEISLSREDIELLKPQIDKAFANLDENLYRNFSAGEISIKTGRVELRKWGEWNYGKSPGKNYDRI